MPIDIPQRGFNGFPEPQIEAIQTIIQFLLDTGALSNSGSSSLITMADVIYNQRLTSWYESAVPKLLADAEEKRWDVRCWTPNERVEVGTIRLPTAYFSGNNDFTIKAHQCTQAGITGSVEPTWATTEYYTNSTTSQTTDATVIWQAFNIYHVDLTAAAGGDGSQLTPHNSLSAANLNAYATLANSAFAPGRVVALKRGQTFSAAAGTNSTGFYSRLLIRKPTGAVATNQFRRALIAYGDGIQPYIDSGESGALSFGIRFAASDSANHEGHYTIQDIEVSSTTGGRSNAGAAGIYAGITTADLTQYTLLPQAIKVIRCFVHDIKPITATSESEPDQNGIQLFGANNAIIKCDIRDNWDDNNWMIGMNSDFLCNRSVGSGASTVYYPNRQRGDEYQLNSSLSSSNGDTPAHNCRVVGNFLHHTRPQKHVFITNPECTGTNRRSHNYLIAWNHFKGYNGADGNSQIAAYISNITGDVCFNYFEGGHIRADNSVVNLFAPVRFYNNYIRVWGTQRGLSCEAYTYTGGSASAAGAEIFNNTFHNSGGLASTHGIMNYGTGVTVGVRNNLFIGFTTGVYLVTGSVAGGNAFWNCTNQYAGAGTLLGSDITADPVTTSGIPYSSTSSLLNAGIRTPQLLSTDFTGAARRRGAPTIGAFEILT